MFKNITIKAIEAYQKSKQKIQPESSCRYSPTCSQYTKEAIIKYGILKGMLLGVARILRCNPLFPGGKDPLK